MKRPIVVESKNSADYSVTTSWTNVAGFECIVPECGYYNIIASFAVRIGTTIGNTIYCAIAVNSNNLHGSNYAKQNTTDGEIFLPYLLSRQAVFLEKRDKITLRANSTVVTSDINYSVGNADGFLQIRKVN